MKKLLVVLMLLCLPFSAFAADRSTGQVVHVGVDGMVCDFCAQSLKKLFLKEKAVQDIDISFEKKMVTLTLKPKMTMDDAAITKVIDYAGYKVSGIHREK